MAPTSPSWPARPFRRMAMPAGTPDFRQLAYAMLFAGLSTFSLLYAVQALLPSLASEFYLSAAEASLAVAFATGPLAIGVLIAGFISDRLGRRSLILFGLAVAGFLTTLISIVPSWPLILLLRCLTGIALANVPAVAMAYICEEVELRSVSRAMGLYIAGSSLGGMSGRLIAGVVAEVAGWRWSLVAIGCGGLAMAEAFRRLAPKSRRFCRRRGKRQQRD